MRLSAIFALVLAVSLFGSNGIRVANAQTRSTGAGCSYAYQQRVDYEGSLELNESGIRDAQRKLRDMQTQDAAVADKYLQYASDTLQRIESSNDSTVLHASLRKFWESAVEFWRAKRTNIAGGGLVNVGGGDYYVASTKADLIVLQRAHTRLLSEIAALDQEIAQCGSARSGASGGPWSGTWTWVGVNGGAVILQQTGSLVKGHLNVRGQDYPTFTLKVSGATATGVADVGLGAPVNLTLTIFGRRFTGKFSANGRGYEPDGYCTAGDCLHNQ